MKIARAVSRVAFAMCAGLVLWAIARADGPNAGPQKSEPPGPSRPQMTDDLDRELFGDDVAKPPAAGQERPEKPAPTAPKPVGPSKTDSLQPGTAKPPAAKQTPSASADDENPEEAIRQTVGAMRDAGARIGRADCGADTQQLQKQIAARLDAMLQQARKRCGACQGQAQGACNSASPSSSGGGSPSTAAKSGNAATKAARNADPNAKPPASGGKMDPQERLSLQKQLWGNLPERQRNMLLQLPAAEEFLPEYDTLIEDYFRGLTEDAAEPR